MFPLVEDMSEIYAHPLPRVYAIFLFAIEYSAKAQHTTTKARGVGKVFKSDWTRKCVGNLMKSLVFFNVMV